MGAAVYYDSISYNNVYTQGRLTISVDWKVTHFEDAGTRAWYGTLVIGPKDVAG